MTKVQNEDHKSKKLSYNKNSRGTVWLTGCELKFKSVENLRRTYNAFYLSLKFVRSSYNLTSLHV